MNSLINKITGFSTANNGYNSYATGSSTIQNLISVYGVSGQSISKVYNYSVGFYIGDSGSILLSGNQNKTNFSSGIVYDDMVFGTAGSIYSVFLVSDGGASLSSINNPSLNANNASAPINQASVLLPATIGLLGLAMAGLSFRRKKA